MRYSEFVEVYEELGKTSKTLEKTKIISGFLEKNEDLSISIALIRGSVFPEWDKKELGISSKLMVKALALCSGESVSKIEKLWKEEGDLGKTAERIVEKKKQTTLSSKKLDVEKVFENIRKLPLIEGKGAVDRKIKTILELLNNSSGREAKYIVKTILCKLRVGVAKGIIRDAIAQRFKVEAKDVERAYNNIGDYGEVAKAIKEKGVKALKDFSLKSGRPLKVMLAVKVDSVEDAFKAVGNPAIFEYKLDGFRVVISKNKEGIKLFTRRMEDVTRQFPDVVEAVKKNVKGKEFVLDSEVVGYDKISKKYLPFQSISQRIKRKYDIEEMVKRFPVEVNVFDVLYYEGKSFLEKDNDFRRNFLKKIVRKSEKKIGIVKSVLLRDSAKAEEFYKESLDAGHEGLIVKNKEAHYIAGRYVNGWVKVKNVMESLDLVITGAQWGEGKRKGWLSSFILSCKSGDKFLTIGKVGTGIKEKEGLTFKKLTEDLEKEIIEREGRNVRINPKVIVEVNYEEIQKSPTYGSGYALRFPRVIRIRDDKGLGDVDDIKRIKKFYDNQRSRK